MLTDIVTKRRDGRVVESFSYTYDNAGNREAILEGDGTSVSFRYDELYHMVMEKRERKAICRLRENPDP